ncbi:UNVERIFIED_CONTAM: hypothetical protein FKN15_005114 [Acipenser sinensis]
MVFLPGARAHQGGTCEPQFSASLLPQAQGLFLGSHLKYWHQCTTDICVLTTVHTGYSLQFKHGHPPFRGVNVTSVTDPQDAAVMSQEVAALLQKRAIHMIDTLQLEEGF